MSVRSVCSACGASAAEQEWPPCKHFRRNRQIPQAAAVAVALGPLEAFFVRRGLQPPFWPSGVRTP